LSLHNKEPNDEKEVMKKEVMKKEVMKKEIMKKEIMKKSVPFAPSHTKKL
jgi:hypothetical protein